MSGDREAVARREGSRWQLAAPGVGVWDGAPAHGAFLRPGDVLGRLEVLGRRRPVRVPAGAEGAVVEVFAAGAVHYGTPLVVLDPSGGAGAPAAREAVAPGAAGRAELVLPSPSSGRFWSRPSPDRAPFVEPGDEVERGTTVGLLEVMKTFSRIPYEGAGLPPRARVRRVVPGDGDDVDEGAPLLELEPPAGP